MFEKKEIAPNLALMRQLAQDLREIVVVGDASETYRAIERQIRSELAQHAGIRARFVTAGRIDALIEGLRAEPSRFVLLSTLGAVTDRQGRTLTLPETVGAIVAAGNFAIFSVEDAYLLTGVLGGYVTSGPRQGATAAALLRRYLDGAPMAAIAPVHSSPNRYVVNDREMARAGVTLAPALAAEAVHLDAEPGFYEANRGLVLGALYLLVASTVLGLAVATYLYARKIRPCAISRGGPCA
ncbi:hypothetical protein CJ010_10635 [Azoarcus sp. DD4]|nr:hypothetical protein CJ010_10635 [Azoarcus sp. DD4]